MSPNPEKSNDPVNMDSATGLELRVPPLPQSSSSLVLRGVHFQGSRLVIAIYGDVVRVQLAGSGATEAADEAVALVVCAAGAEHPLREGAAAVVFPRADAASIRLSGGCGRAGN